MKYAKPEWRNGQPYNPDFADVYFSADNGLAESEHVFIQHNQLLERFKQVAAQAVDNNASQFVIAETGFGSGLNFLLTVKHWLQHSHASQTLCFYSLEHAPFCLQDLQRAQQAWPQLAEFAQALQQAYQVASDGFHLLELFSGRVRLVLMIGEAEQMLGQCQASVDAWFLDGFAPALNQQMWSRGLFQQIKRLSRPGTTFSTYTAVGDVRRGLADVGFAVQKVAGCGNKRHMLKGEFMPQAVPASSAPGYQPWFEGAVSNLGRKSHIAIIGAGIAGLTTAWSLVKRGFKVTVLEQGRRYGAQASGNPHAMLMPRLSLQDAADAEFYSSAYFHALRCLQQLDPQQQGWQQSGGLQLPSTERIRKQIADYPQTDQLVQVLDAQQASEVCGLTVNESAQYFPLAANLQPVKILARLVEVMGDALTIHYSTTLASFERVDEQWKLKQPDGETIASVDGLIFCNAWQVKLQSAFGHLTIQPARGQLSILQANAQSRRLKLPVSSEGYLLPAIEQQHIVGASFELDDCCDQLRDTEHQQNLQAIHSWQPELFSAVDIIGGRASVRAVTPDRMPVLGAAPDMAAYLQDYADFYKGKAAHNYHTGQYLPHLYINSGHGARGFSSAFLCAELLAAGICNESLPVSNRVRYALHPARFLIRRLKKAQTSIKNQRLFNNE
jgi:tRNA 5-methylaminomethyl-2-thiouridine biosynthesis bifunctional protein